MTGKIPKKNPREEIDEYGRNPLHYSVLKGEMDAVEQAIFEGIDVSSQDDNGMTPLHFAAQEQHIEVTKTLLQAGANPNIYDRNGNGPLWVAVLSTRDSFEIVKMLLDSGADPDKLNNAKRTPKDLALEIGHGFEEYF